MIPYINVEQLLDCREIRRAGDALLEAHAARKDAEAALAKARARIDALAGRWPEILRSLDRADSRAAMAALVAEVDRCAKINSASEADYGTRCDAVAGRARGGERERLVGGVPRPLAEVPDAGVVDAFNKDVRPLLLALADLGSAYDEGLACEARVRDAETAERGLVDTVRRRCSVFRGELREFDSAMKSLTDYAREVRAEARDDLAKREEELLADMDRLGVGRDRLLARLSRDGDGATV